MEQAFKQISGQDWVWQLQRELAPDNPTPALIAEDERDMWLDEALKKGSKGKGKREEPSGNQTAEAQQMNTERPYEMKEELLHNWTAGIQMAGIEALHKSDEEMERDFLSCPDFKDIAAD